MGSRGSAGLATMDCTRYKELKTVHSQTRRSNYTRTIRKVTLRSIEERRRYKSLAPMFLHNHEANFNFIKCSRRFLIIILNVLQSFCIASLSCRDIWQRIAIGSITSSSLSPLLPTMSAVPSNAEIMGADAARLYDAKSQYSSAADRAAERSRRAHSRDASLSSRVLLCPPRQTAGCCQ